MVLTSLHPSPTRCSQMTASGFILFVYFKVKYHHVTPAASHFSQNKTLHCLQAPADMGLLLPPPRFSQLRLLLLPPASWVPQPWCVGPSSNQARKIPTEGFHSVSSAEKALSPESPVALLLTSSSSWLKSHTQGGPPRPHSILHTDSCPAWNP